MNKELFIRKFVENFLLEVDKSDWQTGASHRDIIPIRAQIIQTLHSISSQTQICTAHVYDCSRAIGNLPVAETLGGLGVAEWSITLADRALSKTLQEKVTPHMYLRQNREGIFVCPEPMEEYQESSRCKDILKRLGEEEKQKIEQKQAEELRKAIAFSEQEAIRVHIQPSAPPSYDQAMREQMDKDAAYAQHVQEAWNRGEEYMEAKPPVILTVGSQVQDELPPPYQTSLTL